VSSRIARSPGDEAADAAVTMLAKELRELKSTFDKHEDTEVVWRASFDQWKIKTNAQLKLLIDHDQEHHESIKKTADSMNKNNEALKLIGDNTAAIKEILDGHAGRKWALSFVIWAAAIFGGIGTGLAGLWEVFLRHK
jgi:hypothetical protein